MTLRSVLDIDVKDGDFQRFSELFEKYQTALAKTPNVWKRVSEEHAALASNFERVTAAMMAQSQLAREQAERERKEESHLTLADRLWHSIGRSTKETASHIVSATSALLKWGGLLTGIGTGLTFGTIWGIDRLAGSTAADRRTGLGLGMSVGELQAFRTDFSRFVDPNSFLSKLNEMELNPAKAWSFATLTGGAMPTGDTAADAVRLLQAMRARALITPENQLGLLDQQTGLDVGAETWRRLKRTPEAEFQQQLATFPRDVVAFNVPDRAGRALQDLVTQFERAAAAIKDTFADRLAQLAPGIANLSSAFQQLATGVINSVLTNDNLAAISRWVNSLADALKDPETIKSFERYAHELADTVGHIVASLGDFADTLDEFEHHPGTALWHGFGHMGAAYSRVEGAAYGWLGRHSPDWLSGVFSGWAEEDKKEAEQIERDIANENESAAVLRRWRMLKPPAQAQTQSPAEFADHLAALDKRYALPDGLLERVWGLESSRRLAPPDSAKGAIGPMQVMPEVARVYGVDSAALRDPNVSAEAGARILADDMAHYHNDVAKALAAYNFGSGNLDALIARHPLDWQRYLPKETQRYIRGYELSELQPVQVTVARLHQDFARATGSPDIASTAPIDWAALSRSLTASGAAGATGAGASVPYAARSTGLAGYDPPTPHLNVQVSTTPGADVTVAVSQLAGQVPQ